MDLTELQSAAHMIFKTFDGETSPELHEAAIKHLYYVFAPVSDILLHGNYDLFMESTVVQSIATKFSKTRMSQLTNFYLL